MTSSADATRARHAERRQEVLEFTANMLIAGKDKQLIADRLGITVDGLKYMIKTHASDELKALFKTSR